MDSNTATFGLAPFSLKDAPAMIERVFPAQKVGIEAQKERKAVAGQTLTALGAYWKGRKPLVLVRACVLAGLLPATDDPEGDLALFEALMGMDAKCLERRLPEVTADLVVASPVISEQEWAPHVELLGNSANVGEVTVNGGVRTNRRQTLKARWRKLELEHICDPGKRRVERERIETERDALRRRAFGVLPFAQQVAICERVEKVEAIHLADDPFYAGLWERTNERLGSSARTLPELVEQLGIARFGHRPVIGDPFCGGGSIPFEAARLGCAVVASDLNPIAAMLTWGSLHVVGADSLTKARFGAEQQIAAEAVEAEICRLGIEHDAQGNRAKAYLYCLEVVDPQTGWLVPVVPSWVISNTRRCVAKLVPDHGKKRFNIRLVEPANPDEMREAEAGTMRDGSLVYRLSPVPGDEEREFRIPVARLRGDGEGRPQSDGTIPNLLRRWERGDVAPRPPRWEPQADPVVPSSHLGAWIGGDVWQERLYAIQWMRPPEPGREAGGRRETFFRAPSAADLAMEDRIQSFAEGSLAAWQLEGLVSDMEIETGRETEGPIRTNGWKYWHQLFVPRAIVTAQIIARVWGHTPCGALALARYLDNSSKGCRWAVAQSGGDGGAKSTFDNQSLKTIFNWAIRSSVATPWLLRSQATLFISRLTDVATVPASDLRSHSDLFITDPPYADAVHYHEITEFFIAWLRKNLPTEFTSWSWDSRRPLAIKGKGNKFRADMVAAFRAMADHMPENGLQVCMFTHKDAGVWADMAGIVWAAGLRVTAAWYVSTETTSELKQGGYVQGTVLLVLRKRVGEEYGYRSDIVPEVRARVAAQVETLTGLNQSAKGSGRDENLFSDADIQMAGYAAALEVLTSYTHIDGVDMTREALRPRESHRRGQAAEIGIVEEMIALAVQTANERMVPDGFPDGMWERLGSAERFYLKMTAAEAAWPAGASGGKLDDYQNFAKAYRAEGWEDLLADRLPNRARLKSAAEFRGAYLTGHPVSTGALRPTLYAVMGLARDAEKEIDSEASGAQALHGLRDHFGDAEWLRARDNVRILAGWLGRTWERRNPGEAAAARVLASLIASERL